MNAEQPFIGVLLVLQHTKELGKLKWMQARVVRGRSRKGRWDFISDQCITSVCRGAMPTFNCPRSKAEVRFMKAIVTGIYHSSCRTPSTHRCLWMWRPGLFLPQLTDCSWVRLLIKDVFQSLQYISLSRTITKADSNFHLYLFVQTPPGLLGPWDSQRFKKWQITFQSHLGHPMRFWTLH